MLKGVNRQVLEVNMPESKYFERILYIVKPEFSTVPAVKLLKEAKQHGAHTDMPPHTRAAQVYLQRMYAIMCVLALSCIALTVALVLK
ncbi:MAG: hypothetical protein IJG23_01790 [Clostridia bacterium]|nr:hypothetical protein [Clostridia bacterium]